MGMDFQSASAAINKKNFGGQTGCTTGTDAPGMQNWYISGESSTLMT
jgi:hypothetical protein